MLISYLTLETYYMKNKKIFLVTGVAGFIGSKIAEHLIKTNNTVVGLDNLSSGYIHNIPKKVIFFKIDCSSKKLSKILLGYKFDAIFHFSGQSSGEISFENPLKDINSNVVSTVNLYEFCIKNKCRKFLFASSMSVYGENFKIVTENSPLNPLSFYAVGKMASEKYLKLYKNKSVNISVLRLFNVYGPGQDLSNLKQGMISIYLSQLMFNKKIIIKGSKNRYRDFVYIEDVVKACIEISKFNKNEYEIFNICTGKKTKVVNLINKIIQIYKQSKEIIYEQSTLGDQFGIYGNNNKLLSLLKRFEFTNIDKGLKKTINWAKKTERNKIEHRGS